ncbi:hypothetical protein SYNPS1DRAFT_23917 [Syncephalis pseudoplumigaleata]|uniref:Potassium channel domain-containing protein n=1 Tax=Syncephalis pseudoplumigaleata TaxID=1712513 RepID=A0A4P9YVX7_9FUNG|nr:hypothetical protein SYNPS1DRAFT_23917 [Syncephalis pseudoplumigaleata]|eukprot:RKP23988.1 hypothetical protein SYNPS1DRAFT_23917 [Syncephalis pseudoplumigaleata]
MHAVTSQLPRSPPLASPRSSRSRPVAHLTEYQTRRLYILFTGVVMPLTVFMAVPPVVDRWEQTTSLDAETTATIAKPTVVTVLMSLGLLAAVVSNAALYARLLLYHVHVMTAITVAASGLRVLIITVAIVVYHAIMPGASHGRQLSYTSEWYMCITDVVLSSIVFAVLLYDIFYARKYKLKGNGLSHQERFFINTIVVTTLWWSLGSIAFMYLEKWSFLSSLFFTLVTMSTVGFGNMAPTTMGSKLACVVLAVVGVSLLGMLVNSFATMILDNIRQQTMNRLAELRRRRQMRRQQTALDELDPAQSGSGTRLDATQTVGTDIYESVAEAKQEKHDIHGDEIMRKFYFSMASLLVCITLIFAHTENWSYVDSFYFSSITILTIGYGDFVPTSSAGEVIFILYCIAGLACMTHTGLVISQMRGEYVARHIQRAERILRRNGAPNGRDNLRTTTTESASTCNIVANMSRQDTLPCTSVESGAKASSSPTPTTMDREQAMNEILQAAREMRRTLKSMARASVNVPSAVSEPLLATGERGNSYNVSTQGSQSADLLRSCSSGAVPHVQKKEQPQPDEQDATMRLLESIDHRQPTPLGRLVVWHHCHEHMERIILATERLLEIEHM